MTRNQKKWLVSILISLPTYIAKSSLALTAILCCATAMAQTSGAREATLRDGRSTAQSGSETINNTCRIGAQNITFSDITLRSMLWVAMSNLGGRLHLNLNGAGKWATVAASFTDRSEMISLPMDSSEGERPYGGGFQPTPTQGLYRLTVSSDGILTILETASTDSFPDNAVFHQFTGRATWTETETIDLGTGQDVINLEADFDGRYRGPDLTRVQSLGVLATCTVNAHAKGNVRMIDSFSLAAAMTGQGSQPLCTPPASDDLPPNFPLRPQEMPLWCWAASGQMVMNWMRPIPGSVTQCGEANSFARVQKMPALKGIDCCPHNPSCNWIGWPDFESNDFASVTKPEPPTFEEIQEEISCAKRPILSTWQDVHTKKIHMMVLIGYETDGTGSQIVKIYNPETAQILRKQYSVFTRHPDKAYFMTIYKFTPRSPRGGANP